MDRTLTAFSGDYWIATGDEDEVRAALHGNRQGFHPFTGLHHHAFQAPEMGQQHGGQGTQIRTGVGIR